MVEGVTAESSASFLNWQPSYAEHGIATFPVGDDKVPAIRGYQKVGRRGSGELANKFPDAPALGFMCGRRNGITVLDCDSQDERILADALDRHGKTGIVVRSGSGNFDVLGGGYVVAPPSRVAKGQYQFLQGGLDDLDRLPVMQNVPVEAWDNSRLVAEVKQGQRNNKLFHDCLEAARHCDDFDALCDVALTRNSEFLPPLEDDEVMRTAASAWKCETEGRNYIGGRRAVFSESEVLPLMSDPPVGMLLVWARARFKPDCQFWIADGLAERFGWSLRTFKRVRRRALKRDIFILIRPAGFKRPALYGWGLRGLRLRKEGEEGVS